jgi:hypothetical protein
MDINLGIISIVKELWALETHYYPKTNVKATSLQIPANFHENFKNILKSKI